MPTASKVGLELAEAVDNLGVAVLVARGVEVHPQQAHTRQSLLEVLLKALGAVAEDGQRRCAAHGAHLGQGVRGRAVVAHEAVEAAVVCERHIAVLALGREAALAARGNGGIAAAVVEDDGLTVLGHDAADGVDGLVGEGTCDEAPVAGDIHVHHPHLGQLHVAVALGEGHQAVLTVGGLPVCLDRRRGAAQQRLRSVHRRQQDAAVAAVVTWRGVELLVAALVLLVHYHQAQAGKGQEHRRARADDDTGLVGAQHTLPYLDALVVAKT